MSKTSSWLTGLCSECDYPVVVTQPSKIDRVRSDYQWYCSNPDCPNHNKKEHTGDTESPDWVTGLDYTYNSSGHVRVNRDSFR